MSEILIPALFGLLGVIIGGIITTGSTYLLQQRDERKEIKRAARLIDAELLRARGAARIAIKNKHWGIPHAKLRTEAWETYGPVMAPVLSYSNWVDLVKAVLAIDDLSLDRLPGDIPDTTVAQLIPMLEDIEAGLNALTPFVFDNNKRRLTPPSDQ